MHSISGCDTVSSFSGKGKRSWYKLLKSEGFVQSILSKPGDTFTFPQDLKGELELLVFMLYGCKSRTVAAARHELFCSSQCMEKQLPPTASALLQHLIRACDQAAIWKRCDVGVVNTPSPVGHGWVIESGDLMVKWLSKPYAPQKLIELTHCRCKKTQCLGGKCSCVGAGLSCTTLCKCEGCTNTPQSDTPVEIDSDESESDEEEI